MPLQKIPDYTPVRMNMLENAVENIGIPEKSGVSDYTPFGMSMPERSWSLPDACNTYTSLYYDNVLGFDFYSDCGQWTTWGRGAGYNCNTSWGNMTATASSDGTGIYISFDTETDTTYVVSLSVMEMTPTLSSWQISARDDQGNIIQSIIVSQSGNYNFEFTADGTTSKLYIYKYSGNSQANIVIDELSIDGKYHKEDVMYLSYRYGFNNMEKDDELKGLGNSYDFGARIYDPRVGRWLAVDPLYAKFPDNSPFIFSMNNPAYFIDIKGEEPIKPLAGTIAQFKAILDNSPRKVGAFKGKDAHSYMMSLSNTTMNWNQFRPEPTETPYFNSKQGRYIYTEKGGWIDMTHFLFYASKAYNYKIIKEKAIHNREKTQRNMEKTCSSGDCFWPPIIPKSPIEDICPIGRAVQDGYIQEMTDRYIAPHSAYSYEDIPSNFFGADFGANYFDPSSDKTFSEQIESYFIYVLHATEPQNAPNFQNLPETDPTQSPSRTNHTTKPVFTNETP